MYVCMYIYNCENQRFKKIDSTYEQNYFFET